MSKAAEREIEAMAHLATEVDKVRPIDRQRVAELVSAGARLQREFGDEAAQRVTAWLIDRAEADTDAANHEAELRRAAKAKAAEPEPETGDPAPDPGPIVVGPTGHPIAMCDEVGHSRCELVPSPEGGEGAAEVLHHLAA